MLCYTLQPTPAQTRIYTIFCRTDQMVGVLDKWITLYTSCFYLDRNFKHRGGQYCSIGITMKRSTATVRGNVNMLVCVPKCKDNPTSTSRTQETNDQHTQLQSTIYISAVKRSIGFTIMEKAPNRAFSWLKSPTSAFTFKTLC